MSKTVAQAESIKQDAYLTIIKLARQYKEEGLFNQSEDFYRQAIAMARNLPAGSSDASQKSLLMDALRELAVFYAFLGKDERSESLWTEILELGKNNLNASDSLYIESILGLAIASEKKGNMEKAEALYKDLLPKQEIILGGEALEICPAIKKMGAFYYRRQQYPQAEALYLKALAIEEYHLGTCSEQINNTVDALIDLFGKQKKWRLAEYMLDRQKDILNILHGKNSLCAASCELRLAELLRQTGQIEKAIQSYDTVLRIYTNIFGAQSRPVASLKSKRDQLLAPTISFAPEKQMVLPASPLAFIAV